MEEKDSWVVFFACPDDHTPETIIVEGVTREAALKATDGLGCEATDARRLEEVVLRREPWKKDGKLRCEVA